jgi:pimeloyl-ACP methyl ester carboxylesterase
MANHLGTVYGQLDWVPRWRRTPAAHHRTLVIGGRHDRFFPVGKAETIARWIPGVRPW